MAGEHMTFDLADAVSHSMPLVGETTFGFTRYLYIIDDVKSSLVISILEQNREEALFWAYELYFSGLKTDVLWILELMATVMYASLNPRLLPFLESKKAEWEKTNSYTIVGTFIYNMVGRPYDITEFITIYCKDQPCMEYMTQNPRCGIASTPSHPGRKIYINVEQKDVKKYITVNHIKPHYLLRTVAKYPVRINTRGIFEHDHHRFTHAQIQSLYWYRWLYYACVSPIWGERIAKYGGTLNHDKYTVEFATYEQDEEFHNKYNLEPDEQPIEVQTMNIGDDLYPSMINHLRINLEHLRSSRDPAFSLSHDNQMTWIEFYEKYSHINV